ncbi:hypothetical protein ACFP81_07580 [Deinococcus lacus]|uniref:Uncharacterized protein n=1 Tax=Deinococcus lacus TaxID=392561 RepID=A0ABW1YC48_9DEIO
MLSRSMAYEARFLLCALVTGLVLAQGRTDAGQQTSRPAMTQASTLGYQLQFPSPQRLTVQVGPLLPRPDQMVSLLQAGASASVAQLTQQVDRVGEVRKPCAGCLGNWPREKCRSMTRALA